MIEESLSASSPASATSTEQAAPPLEWLETDMKTGLTSATVESRRKKTGWNELTTEKENPFLKFLGYFRGPILYGEFLLFLVDHLKQAN